MNLLEIKPATCHCVAKDIIKFCLKYLGYLPKGRFAVVMALTAGIFLKTVTSKLFRKFYCSSKFHSTVFKRHI
jgi:hypothetical protein